MSDAADGGGVEPRKVKRPRRASAPPTAAQAQGEASETPDADWSDWLTKSQRTTPRGLDAHDAWMHDQRPPHWN